MYMFSTTERYSKSFNCFQQEYVVDRYDMKFIDEIVKAQRARIDKYGKDSPKVSDILLIFDDLLGSIKPNSLEQQQLNWYLFHPMYL